MFTFYKNGRFDTALIMSEAHRMARESVVRDGFTGRKHTDETRPAYRDEFKHHLAWCWELARDDKKKARVSPFDGEIASMEAEILVFDMSARANFHSPEMATMKARLGELTSARAEFLEAA